MIFITIVTIVTSSSVKSAKNLQLQFPPLNVQGSIQKGLNQRNLTHVILTSNPADLDPANRNDSSVIVNVYDRYGNIVPLSLTPEQLPLSSIPLKQNNEPTISSSSNSKQPIIVIIPQEQSPLPSSGTLSDDRPFDPIAELIRIVVQIVRDFIRARRERAQQGQQGGSGSNGHGHDHSDLYSDTIILPIL